MKVTLVKKYKTKLLKLKLLKTKTYKFKKDINYLLLKNIETRLKKVLHIIYRFHISNKKILFIGTPLKLDNQIKSLLKNKKHSFIPENVWMNGIVTNLKSSFKHLIKEHAVNENKTSRFLFCLKNQADLIVILNERSNLLALKESLVKRTPNISLNTSHNLFSFHLSTYKALGDYNFTKKAMRNNFFFLLLNSTLKKAEQAKTRKNQYLKKKK